MRNHEVQQFQLWNNKSAGGAIILTVFTGARSESSVLFLCSVTGLQTHSNKPRGHKGSFRSLTDATIYQIDFSSSSSYSASVRALARERRRGRMVQEVSARR